ncbi:hypothetical protein D3C72_2376040 [compost metagenome]
MQRLGKEHLATVILVQHLGTDEDLPPFALAGHDPRPPLLVPTEQYRAATFAQQQQSRHGQRRNFVQIATQPAPLQAGASGRTG